MALLPSQRGLYRRQYADAYNMGTSVGGLILFVNPNTFFGAIKLSSGAAGTYVLLIGVRIAALAFAIGARIKKRQ